MKIEVKEIYKCSYCNKLYQIKSACEKHENACTKNPDNKRACHECMHLTKKQTNIYRESYYGGEDIRHVDLLHCEKLNKFIYPPSVEHKGNAFDLGDEINSPMPKECDHQKSYLELGFWETS